MRALSELRIRARLGPNNKVLFSVERDAARMLGIVHCGFQLIVHTFANGSKLPSIWISKRGKFIAGYSGMLGSTASGDYRAGRDLLGTVIREAEKTASIPADLVRSLARPCGTISYVRYLDERLKGEKYLVQLELDYMYEMQVPEGFVPGPSHFPVEWLQLWDADKIKDGLGKGLFRPSHALALLDFFIRHGVLDPKTEPDYTDICSRLHRTLEFPLGGLLKWDKLGASYGCSGCVQYPS